jgi:hypothetical protein
MSQVSAGSKQNQDNKFQIMRGVVPEEVNPVENILINTWIIRPRNNPGYTITVTDVNDCQFNMQATTPLPDPSSPPAMDHPLVSTPTILPDTGGASPPGQNNSGNDGNPISDTSILDSQNLSGQSVQLTPSSIDTNHPNGVSTGNNNGPTDISTPTPISPAGPSPPATSLNGSPNSVPTATDPGTLPKVGAAKPPDNGGTSTKPTSPLVNDDATGPTPIPPQDSSPLPVSNGIEKFKRDRFRRRESTETSNRTWSGIQTSPPLPQTTSSPKTNQELVSFQTTPILNGNFTPALQLQARQAPAPSTIIQGSNVCVVLSPDPISNPISTVGVIASPNEDLQNPDPGPAALVAPITVIDYNSNNQPTATRTLIPVTSIIQFDSEGQAVSTIFINDPVTIQTSSKSSSMMTTVREDPSTSPSSPTLSLSENGGRSITKSGPGVLFWIGIFWGFILAA